MAKNVEMNHLNENGEYEVVYPLVNTNTIVDFDDIVLSDAAKIIMNLSDTATPNEAFIHLALGNNAYPFLIQVNFPDGTPAEGVTITGATDPLGNTIVTNAKGQGVAVSDTETLSIGATTNWIDLESIATTSFTHDDNVITNVVLNFAYSSTTTKTLTQTQNFKFSPMVATYDVCACGGGGGGGSGGWGDYYATSGGGGGGGYVINKYSFKAFINTNYSATIGSGGSGANRTTYNSGGKGGTGGTTSLAFNSNTLISASGGTGGGGGKRDSYDSLGSAGIGNGNGGKGGCNVNGNYGTSGVAGSVYIFDTTSLGKLSGGGEGGFTNGGSGGAPYGGTANSGNTTVNGNKYGGDGGAGTGFGGGGAGGKFATDDAYTGGGAGGAGYQGALYIRWYYKN